MESEPFQTQRKQKGPFLLDAQPEPPRLQTFKSEVGRRWPMTSLLDVLKETHLRVGFSTCC